jgi:hypothetical protein
MDEKSVRAGRACRRAILGAAASGRNPLRPPCGPDRPTRTAAQGPRKKLCFDGGHRGLARSEIQLLASPACARRMRAEWGPRMRRALGGNARRVAHRKCASSPQAQGCAVGAPRRARADPQHMDVRRAHPRGGLLFGDFLLATQEKVTRAPGGARKKTGTSNLNSKSKMDPGLRRDDGKSGKPRAMSNFFWRFAGAKATRSRRKRNRDPESYTRRCDPGPASCCDSSIPSRCISPRR